MTTGRRRLTLRRLDFHVERWIVEIRLQEVCRGRQLDAEIVQWIDNERPRGASSGSSNAARAAKKPKAAPAQVDNAFEFDERALDPFGE